MGKNKIEIHVIKTDKGCFISDCNVSDGYYYNYHTSKIDNLLFDGKKPQATFSKNWLFIEKMPKVIMSKRSDKRINIRYELKDISMESDHFPLTILELDYEDEKYPFYEYKYDIEKGEYFEINPEINIIAEVKDFQIPNAFEYEGLRKWNYSDEKYTITSANIEHQLLDKIAFPDILLSLKPSKISSEDLYCIVRNYIKENIDKDQARITSDYDFCFTVKKIIPLYEIKKFTYTNPFESTKKKRQKIHHGVKEYNEYIVWEMTSEKSNYDRYPVLDGITAETQDELKKKIDLFLEDLIYKINKPFVPCPHCEGKGYLESE
jgi:hypothetical protein